MGHPFEIEGLCGLERLGLTWKSCPLYTFWSVWKDRNKIVVRDEVLSIKNLKYSLLQIFFGWRATCFYR